MRYGLKPREYRCPDAPPFPVQPSVLDEEALLARRLGPQGEIWSPEHVSDLLNLYRDRGAERFLGDPSHTTRHAGPHRAVRSVELTGSGSEDPEPGSTSVAEHD
jgi:hypothetical protein